MSIKGSLLQISRNSNSSKLSCMSSIPARKKKIKLKMKALECSQDFSHYKSNGIFPDAQGQLTPQSLVRSSRISNSSEMLWLSLLPANLNEGARVFTTLYINFSDAQGQITQVGGCIWPKFELIQAFMHVLVTCKNEDDRFKNEGARVFTRFLPLWGFFQTLKGS